MQDRCQEESADYQANIVLSAVISPHPAAISPHLRLIPANRVRDRRGDDQDRGKEVVDEGFFDGDAPEQGAHDAALVVDPVAAEESVAVKGIIRIREALRIGA